MSLLKQSKIRSYKPFLYPKAYELYKEHEAVHWLPEQVNLGEDLKDWETMEPKAKEFVHSILNLFTQSDVEVGRGYDALLRVFKPTEVQMYLRGNAARECIHIDSYSLFQDTIGLPEETYSEFMQIKEMYDKMEYVVDSRVKKYEEYHEIAKEAGAMWATDAQIENMIEGLYKTDVAKMLGIQGGLVEGTALFSSFIMLLNYQRFNKLPGLCQIVTWSIRDEELHCRGNAWLFKTFVKENPEIWNDTLKHAIYQSARDIVDLEDKFIDRAFEVGYTEGLDAYEMKQYIRYMADKRLMELGLKPNWDILENPLPWVEDILNTPEFANFFDTTPTEYAHGTVKGWDELRRDLTT